MEDGVWTPLVFAKADKVVRTAVALYNYRVHADSISHRKLSDAERHGAYLNRIDRQKLILEYTTSEELSLKAAKETVDYFHDMVSSGYDHEVVDIYEPMRDVVTTFYPILESASSIEMLEMLRQIKKESNGREFLRRFFRYELRSKDMPCKDKLKLIVKKLLRGR